MLWVGGWGEPMRFSKEGMQQACMSNFTKLNKLLIHSTAISLDALYAAFFTVLQKLPGYAEQLASAQASHATYANVARLYQFFFCSVTAVVCTTQDPPNVCTTSLQCTH